MDGAHNFKGVGLGVIILDYKGKYFEYSMRMDLQVINNIVENEVAIFGAITSKKLKVNNIILHND